ncbi:hypothetical protein DXG01_013175 [Tephrocybe rancida]|nr:hypothetical protein DXG01_013175 [Tephrocybe rancida]
MAPQQTTALPREFLIAPAPQTQLVIIWAPPKHGRWKERLAKGIEQGEKMCKWVGVPAPASVRLSAAADLQKFSKPPQAAETLPPASAAAQELLRDDRKETEIKIWRDIPRVNNITRDLPNVDVAPLSTASETEAPGLSTPKWFIIPNMAAAARLIQNESVAFLQFAACFTGSRTHDAEDQPVETKQHY